MWGALCGRKCRPSTCIDCVREHAHVFPFLFAMTLMTSRLLSFIVLGLIIA
jgi:hypothetical protein